MMTLKLDDQDLLVAVAQDRLTGEVRMVAWMNEAALRRTLETGRATFYSRSRGALWEKGETSGHTMYVESVHVDCDGDTILLLVDPVGPSCHTGSPTCFFRRLSSSGDPEPSEREAVPFLLRLEGELVARTRSTAEKSYTRSLLDGGAAKIGEKVREEAAELADALSSETDERVLSEAGDLLYHLMVGLRLRGLEVRQVVHVLAKRSGSSGLEEKARRPGK